MRDPEMLITVDAAPASDGWGFVGRVLVGEHEAYRTLRAYPVPGDALAAAQVLIAGVFGSFLAGQEWHLADQDVREAPRRKAADPGLRPVERD